MPVATFLGAVALASVHLIGERLTFLTAIPRSSWLSFAGGVSVAYVFVHILPELTEHQSSLQSVPFLRFLEDHVYVVALAGLVIFYGLERLVREDEKRGRERGEHSWGVFRLHLTSFALYNGLIAYVLVDREFESSWALILFLFALMLHFVVNDHGLRQEHRAAYRSHGRWFLSAAVLAGWAVSSLVTAPPSVVAVLFALLAGGIVLNVLKEELPEERRSRFLPFLAGAAGYGAVLLLAA